MVDPRRALILMSWARVGIGAGLLLLPGRAARVWLGRATDPGAKATMRAIGGRDLALGTGLLRADRNKEPVAGWIAASALADASDAAATALSYRHLPRATRLPILLSAAVTAATEVAIRVALQRRSAGQERVRRWTSYAPLRFNTRTSTLRR